MPESVAECRVLSQQAIISMDNGRWLEAEDLLSRAVESCPSDPDARRQYGEVLLQRGAANEALVQLEDAIRLTPRDTALVVRTGGVYLSAGRYVEARQRANEAIGLDVESADAWGLRGRIELAEGNRRQALADFHRAIGYRPDDPTLLNDVARLYMQMQQPERALLYLQYLTDTYDVVGEESLELVLLQGRALAELGRYHDAVDYYQMACHRQPDSAERFYQLAKISLRAGRPHKARAAVHHALKLDPGHASARSFVAELPEGKALR
ncbi:MAG: tetratricopeptide repeat protein [Planctomycetales bacterium]